MPFGGKTRSLLRPGKNKAVETPDSSEQQENEETIRSLLRQLEELRASKGNNASRGNEGYGQLLQHWEEEVAQSTRLRQALEQQTQFRHKLENEIQSKEDDIAKLHKFIKEKDGNLGGADIIDPREEELQRLSYSSPQSVGHSAPSTSNVQQTVIQLQTEIGQKNRRLYELKQLHRRIANSIQSISGSGKIDELSPSELELLCQKNAERLRYLETERNRLRQYEEEATSLRPLKAAGAELTRLRQVEQEVTQLRPLTEEVNQLRREAERLQRVEHEFQEFENDIIPELMREKHQLQEEVERLRPLEQEVTRLRPLANDVDRLQRDADRLVPAEHAVQQLEGEISSLLEEMERVKRDIDRLRPLESEVDRLRPLEQELTRLRALEPEVNRLRSVEEERDQLHQVVDTLQQNIEGQIKKRGTIKEKLDMTRAELDARLQGVEREKMDMERGQQQLEEENHRLKAQIKELEKRNQREMRAMREAFTLETQTMMERFENESQSREEAYRRRQSESEAQKEELVTRFNHLRDQLVDNRAETTELRAAREETDTLRSTVGQLQDTIRNSRREKAVAEKKLKEAENRSSEFGGRFSHLQSQLLEARAEIARLKPA